MESVKKIQCPSCGATSTFKVNPNLYRCNYCQTEFKLEQQDTNPGNLRTQELFEQKNATLKKSPLACLPILLVFFLTLGGVVAFSIYSKFGGNKNGLNESLKQMITGKWQTPTLYVSTIASGEKGPVIINILKQQTSSLDSARIIAQIINPKTNTKTLTSPIITGSWRHLTFDDNSFFSSLYVINNIIYVLGKDSGLIGYDPYTFQQKIFSKNLQKQFVLLQSGISKVEKDYTYDAFKITNNEAEVFYFFPAENKLLTEKEFDNKRYQKTAAVPTVFFTYGKRPFLFSAIGNPNNNAILSIEDTLKLKEERAWLKSAYGISNIKVVGKNAYFRLKVIDRYQLGVIVAYTESLDPKSPLTLSYINNEGKAIWKNTNGSLQHLAKTGSNDALNFEAKIINNELLLTTYDYPKQFYGFNVQNGQQLWSYTNEK